MCNFVGSNPFITRDSKTSSNHWNSNIFFSSDRTSIPYNHTGHPTIFTPTLWTWVDFFGLEWTWATSLKRNIFNESEQNKGPRNIFPEPFLWSRCTEALFWTLVFSTVSAHLFGFSPIIFNFLQLIAKLTSLVGGNHNHQFPTTYVLCYPTLCEKSVLRSLCTNLFSNGKYTVQSATCPAVQPFSLWVLMCISDQQPGTVYIPMERPSWHHNLTVL